MYNPMVEEIRKLDAKVKDLTKKIEIYKEQVKILKAKLEEKGNDRDNKTNSWKFKIAETISDGEPTICWNR